MEKLLQRRGYHVRAAATCAEAFAAAQQQRFDILITDVGLTDGNGVDLLTQLRAVAPIGCIVVSGHESLNDIDKRGDLDHTQFLVKPVNIETLYDAIARVGVAASIAVTPTS